MASSATQVPPTPMVISPSPTPSERSNKDGYFGVETRSAKNARLNAVERIDEDATNEHEEDPDLAYVI